MNNTYTAKVCFDRLFTREQQEQARILASEHDLAPKLAPFEGAAQNAKLWKPVVNLRATFLDGIPLVQERVQNYARQWMEYANIKFDFRNDADSEIRISFQPIWVLV